MTEIIFDRSIIINPDEIDVTLSAVNKSLGEEVQLNEFSIDSAGEPNFSELAKGRVARRLSEIEIPQIPNRADLFIAPNSLDYHFDFEEPPPYFLNTEEWNTYEERIKKIEKRRIDALAGTF